MTNKTLNPFTGRLIDDPSKRTKMNFDSLKSYYLGDQEDYHFVLYWMFQELITHKDFELSPRQRYVALTLYSLLNDIFLTYHEGERQRQLQL